MCTHGMAYVWKSGKLAGVSCFVLWDVEIELGSSGFLASAFLYPQRVLFIPSVLNKLLNKYTLTVL